MHVLVTAPGPISGSVGTICVRGSITEKERKRWATRALTGSVTLRIRVVAGNVMPPPPDPEPTQPQDVDIPVTDQTWCARNVPVPAAGGAALTAIVWQQLAGSGGPVWGPPDSVQFLG